MVIYCLYRQGPVNANIYIRKHQGSYSYLLWIICLIFDSSILLDVFHHIYEKNFTSKTFVIYFQFDLYQNSGSGGGFVPPQGTFSNTWRYVWSPCSTFYDRLGTSPQKQLSAPKCSQWLRLRNSAPEESTKEHRLCPDYHVLCLMPRTRPDVLIYQTFSKSINI